MASSGSPTSRLAAEDRMPPEDLLAGLFEERVSVAHSQLDGSVDALDPGERALVSNAIESRQREFATGRGLARQLLALRGIVSTPLLRDEDRVPVWPDSIVGSISHTKNLAAVAIANADAYFGIGLDVELDEPVSEGIDRVVCRPEEREWLGSGSEHDRMTRCRIIFSVKEAVYKAFYPRIRTFWNFHDVSVEIDLSAARFVARLPASAGRERVAGRVDQRAGWILSAVEVPI